MKNKGMTITMVVEGESANYGEGYGNITTLKKMTRADGNTYSYISRQAIRYNIVEQMGCDNTPVEENGTGDKKVIQFHPDASITDYPEIDLFGYMKTKKGGASTTRNAVVRISNAISLEEYHSDIDFLTNMGLAKRLEKDNVNSIAQSEIHKSYYTYTITIDLEKIGVDGDINLSEQEKKKRVKEFLKTVQYLYRDIKGRRENLAPVFAIGGIYDRKNPYFENRIRLENNKLDVKMLQDIIESEEEIKNNTIAGYLENTFANSAEIKETLHAEKVSDFFASLIKKMEEEC